MTELIVDVGEVVEPVAEVPDKTVADLVRMVESYLRVGVRTELDKLASGVTADAATLTTTYQVPAIKTGARLSIDLEDYHVWSVSGASVTVQPGMFGSTSASHDTGSIIHVNAEYTPAEIVRELNNELAGLSAPGAGLFRPNTVTLTFNPTYLGYDLTDVTNVDGILTVVAETAGSSRARVPVPFRLERNVDTATFPSGMALMVYEGWSGRDVVVTFKDQFGSVDSLTDFVAATTGLPSSVFDVLAMGAALRLAGVAEIGRNQMVSQGSSRRANEVPAGSRVNAVRFAVSEYRERRAQEADRLKRAYPTRLPRW